MNWLTLKAKLWGLAAIVGSVFAFLVRLEMVKRQRDKAIEEANVAHAKVLQRQRIDKLENELDEKYKSHRAEIVHGTDTTVYDVLSNPDGLRDKDGTD